jgi:hypothetical protein
MKFICLVYNDEKSLEALSDGELGKLVGECGAWVADLEEGGYHVSSMGLQSVRTATTVRSRGGKMAVTDGPFAETKEQLGGFTVIEARDLNEALQLASRLPAARIGSIEVRPVLEVGADFTTALDRKIGVAMRRHARAGSEA